MLYAAKIAKPGQPLPPKPPKPRPRAHTAMSMKARLEALGEEIHDQVRDKLLAGANLNQLGNQLHDAHWPEMKVSGVIKGLERFRDALQTDLAKAELTKHHATIEREKQQAMARRLDTIHDQSMNVLGRLVTVTDLQMDRLQRAAQLEAQSGKIDPTVNTMIRDYADLLAQVQKTQFELGVNEFKGPMTAMRGMSVKTTNADGTTQEKHVYEAVTAVEEIFRKRGILLEAPPTEPTPTSYSEGAQS